MAWLNKDKEKELLPPPDARPRDVPQLVKHVHRRDLVKVMDKIWKPYEYESDEFEVEVQECQRLMDLVYTIYRKYGTREQKHLLDDYFNDDGKYGLPRDDDQRSDWVGGVGSTILREPLLRDELKLNPMLTFITKLVWLKELELEVGKGELKKQWNVLPYEFNYLRDLLRPHLDDPAAWTLHEKCAGESVWKPRLINRHNEVVELSDAVQTAFVARAYSVLTNERDFQMRVMQSLRK